MGKKLPIISTLILALGTIPSPIAMASSGEYWTYDEMAALSKEFLAEMKTACEGQDPWCMEMYQHRLFEMDEKHQALMNYEAVPMVITSVNPSKKTVSVIYRDDFLRDMIYGMTDDTYVKDLFIVRYDKNQQMIAYEAEIKNGTIGDKIHQEVIEFEKNNGEKWMPTNEEVTFSMSDGAFDDNMINKFWYYFSTPRGNWGHMMNPSECLTQIMGVPDMECRLVYRANNVDYIPNRVPSDDLGEANETNPLTPKNPDNLKRIDDEILEEIENDLKGTDPGNDPDTDPNPDTDPGNGQNTDTGTETNNDETEPAETPEHDSVSNHLVLTPDTGTFTEGKNEVSESSWWVTVLGISGLLLLVWWFLPTKYAKITKKSKKVEKRG